MSETILVCIINSVVTVVIGVLSVLVSIKISNNTTKKEIRHFKEQETYRIKEDAIYETLQFFDDYISWLTREKNTIQPIRNDVSAKDLTIKARTCYNKLCTTCDNESLIEYFNKMVFGCDDPEIDEVDDDDNNVYSLLNKFRNSAREELGLRKIELNRKRVFIIRVSTEELNEKEEEQLQDK